MADKSKKRKLTEAEQKRLMIFENSKTELTKEGYTETDLTTTSEKANLIGPLYGLLLSILFIGIFVLTRDNREIKLEDNFFLKWIIFIAIMLVLIVVHELIHGLTWSRFATNGFKSISFGIILKMLTPYCTCNEPLKKHSYITGVIMPCLVLGIIPCATACIIQSMWLLAMGVIMIICAGGDLLLLKMIFEKKLDEDALFLDHPTEIGVAVFEKK